MFQEWCSLIWTVFNTILQITREKLNEIFSEKGIVTVVQLKYTKDGKFRRFGFVGFKTEEEAQNAVEHFNNTCIKASRIKVELCASLGKWHIIDNSLNIFVGITCPCSVNYVFCCWILKTDKCSNLTFILLGGYLNFNAWHMKKWIIFEQKKR